MLSSPRSVDGSTERLGGHESPRGQRTEKRRDIALGTIERNAVALGQRADNRIGRLALLEQLPDARANAVRGEQEAAVDVEKHQAITGDGRSHVWRHAKTLVCHMARSARTSRNGHATGRACGTPRYVKRARRSSCSRA